jgi:hypothetical protein
VQLSTRAIEHISKLSQAVALSLRVEQLVRELCASLVERSHSASLSA